MQMSTDELTIEVRPRSSTAPAAAAAAPGDDDDSLSVKSAGSSDQRKHKVTSSTDEQLSRYTGRAPPRPRAGRGCGASSAP